MRVGDQWEFKPRGQSGKMVSDLFPHLAKQIDEVALIRSMHTSHSNHYNATLGMHTGSFNQARPGLFALDAATGELRWVHSEREGARAAASHSGVRLVSVSTWARKLIT